MMTPSDRQHRPARAAALLLLLLLWATAVGAVDQVGPLAAGLMAVQCSAPLLLDTRG
jgi:hypothetical protein